MSVTREDAELVMAALDAGLRGDGESYDAAFNEIVEKLGWPGFFGALCGFAGALVSADPMPGDPAQVIGLAAVNLATGKQVNIEDTDLPPDLIAATRIIVAVYNKDFSLANDVFWAELDAGRAEDTGAWVSALVIYRLKQLAKFREVYGEPGERP